MVVHPSLRRFLRRQFEDLALARELRRGMPDAAMERFRNAWARDLGERLTTEVRRLTPLGTPRLSARLITMVASLRDYAEGEVAACEPADVRELGARLEEYLLWKERELLPMLEVVATPPQLDRLGRNPTSV